MNIHQRLNAANPTFERLELDTSHVIWWKWHLVDTRGPNWPLLRVCWIDGY